MDKLPKTQIRQPGKALPLPRSSWRNSTTTCAEDVGITTSSPSVSDDSTPATIAPLANACSSSIARKWFTRHVGSKQTKEELRNVKHKELMMQAQAQAVSETTAANMKKTQVLDNQAMLCLFTLS